MTGRPFVAPLLGLRLVRGQGRTGVLRMALMALGTALGVGMLLLALSVPHVILDRKDRVAARTPVCAAELVDCRIGTQADGQWYGQTIVHLLVDAPAGTAAPAGLARLPRPGEVVLSPALQRLADKPGNGLLRDRLRGKRIGTVGPAGLLQPDELVAYTGVTAVTSYGPTRARPVVTGYGRPEVMTTSDGVETYTHGSIIESGHDDFSATQTGEVQQRRITVGVAVIALLVPVLLFLGTCARLSARTRDRRLSALRLIGMTPWETRVVNAVETGIAAVAGAALGLLAFELSRAPLSRLTVDGYGWYASDLTPTAGQVALLLTCCPLVAVAVGAVAVRRLTGPLAGSRTGTGPRRMSLWRLLPLAAGALLLGVAHAIGGEAGDRSLTALGGGMALCLVGLASATPLLAQLAAGGLARLSGSVSVQLGARRLQTEAAAVGRVVSGLVLLVFVAGFSQIVLLAVEQQVRHSALSQQSAPLRPDLLGASARTTAGAAVPGSTWAGLPGIGAVVGFRRLAPAPGQSSAGGVVVATCADLRAVLTTPLDGCQEGSSYQLVAPGARAAKAAGSPVRVVDEATRQADMDPATGDPLRATPVLTVPAPARTLQIADAGGIAGFLGGGIIVPPGDPLVSALAPAPPQQFYLHTDGTPTAAEVARTAAQRVDPALEVYSLPRFLVFRRRVPVPVVRGPGRVGDRVRPARRVRVGRRRHGRPRRRATPGGRDAGRDRGAGLHRTEGSAGAGDRAVRDRDHLCHRAFRARRDGLRARGHWSGVRLSHPRLRRHDRCRRDRRLRGRTECAALARTRRHARRARRE